MSTETGEIQIQIQSQRMHAARALLASGWTVAATARETGYRSSTSFSAAFARAFGTSPQQFKREAGAKVVEVARETARGSPAQPPYAGSSTTS